MGFRMSREDLWAVFLWFQERLGRMVDAGERIVALIPEYATHLMSRLRKGADGKVAYERRSGKNPSVLGGSAVRSCCT